MDAELVSDTGATQDVSGGATRTTRYIVLTSIPEVALQATGIPSLGAAHPSDPKMLLDAHSTSLAGRSTFVDCRYSNDRRFSPPVRIARQLGYQKRRTIISRDERTKLYYNIRTTATISNPRTPDGGGGGSRTIQIWAMASAEITEQRYILPIECRVQIADESQLDVIAFQRGKFHRSISGLVYRFLGLTADKEEGEGWRVLRYEWEYDQGTLKSKLPTSSRLLFLDPSDRAVHPTLFRLPFETHTQGESDDAERIPHDTFAFSEVTPNDFNAWRQLPGGPILA